MNAVNFGGLNMEIHEIVKNAFVAAVYVVLTLVVAPHLSYGEVQFRISEALLILVLFNKKYWLGLLVGTFLANLGSPLGIIDWVVGTSASALSIYFMLQLKNKLALCLLVPAIINGLFVGIELYYVFQVPLLAGFVSVFFGEFVVVFILGGILYKTLEHNEGFLKVIR